MELCIITCSQADYKSLRAPLNLAYKLVRNDMHFSWILGVCSFFFQLCASESALKRQRKLFVRPCFPEDEPSNYLSRSHLEEDSNDCDKETSANFKLSRLEASKVSL